MKIRYLLLIIVLLLIILLIVGCGKPNPYNVQPDGYAIIKAPLSLEKGKNTTFIPHGSVIYHWANGITEVYGPDSERLFIARDSEAATTTAPGGPKPATFTLQVPDGAHISNEGDNTTKIYQGDTLLLTISMMSDDFQP